MDEESTKKKKLAKKYNCIEKQRRTQLSNCTMICLGIHKLKVQINDQKR